MRKDVTQDRNKFLSVQIDNRSNKAMLDIHISIVRWVNINIFSSLYSCAENIRNLNIEKQK